MAQGQFTKEEIQKTCNAVDEIFEALPRSKRLNFLGHLNDIYLLLSAAEKVAPSETEAGK